MYRPVRDELGRRERAEEGERLRRAALSRLASSTMIGIVVNAGEVITEANDAFLRMVGRSAADLIEGGIDWRAMAPPEYVSLDEHAIAEIVATGTNTPYEKEFIHRDGTRIPVLVGRAALESEPLRWVAFVVDLSARRAREEEHQEMLETNAHDLLSPITAALCLVQVMQHRLQEKWLDLGGIKEGLEGVDTALAQMAMLIDDLMDIARVRLASRFTSTWGQRISCGSRNDVWRASAA